MAMALGDDLDVDFKLGANQVDRLYLGRSFIWPQHPIDDFEASNNLVKKIKVTWSDSNYPLPYQYDLYENGIRMYADIKNGDELDALTGIAEYYVRSIYEGGHGVDSNTDIGEALSGIPPGPITDFEASNGQVLSVQFWWTNATGDPRPTYNLYQNGNPLRSNVSSGHKEVMPPGSWSFYVKAINAEGERNSNSNTGSAVEEPYIPPPGSIEYTSAGQYGFVVPFGVTSLTMCYIGGGGAGGTARQSTSVGGIANAGAGGGGAGAEGSTVLSVSSGQELIFTVGAGGEGITLSGGANAIAGNEGFSSGIGNITAAGGRGGGASTIGNPTYYLGNGQPGASGCGGGPRSDGVIGRLTDGLIFTGYGGQASTNFNGGSGAATQNGLTGWRGAGGGGSCVPSSLGNNRGGNGGDGIIQLSWGGYKGEPVNVDDMNKNEFLAYKIKPLREDGSVMTYEEWKGD